MADAGESAAEKVKMSLSVDPSQLGNLVVDQLIDQRIKARFGAYKAWIVGAFAVCNALVAVILSVVVHIQGGKVEEAKKSVPQQVATEVTNQVSRAVNDRMPDLFMGFGRLQQQAEDFRHTLDGKRDVIDALSRMSKDDVNRMTETMGGLLKATEGKTGDKEVGRAILEIGKASSLATGMAWQAYTKKTSWDAFATTSGVWRTVGDSAEFHLKLVFKAPNLLPSGDIALFIEAPYPPGREPEAFDLTPQLGGYQNSPNPRELEWVGHTVVREKDVFGRAGDVMLAHNHPKYPGAAWTLIPLVTFANTDLEDLKNRKRDQAVWLGAISLDDFRTLRDLNRLPDLKNSSNLVLEFHGSIRLKPQ